MKSSELITWEVEGKGRKHFDYQNQPPTGRRNTRKYQYVQWGDVEHHWHGGFLQTRGFKPVIPGVTREWLLDVYREELKSEFQPEELDQLGDRDGAIVTDLLKTWREDFNTSVYDDPRYVFETVSCGLNVTGMLTGSKLRNASPILHTLMWWDHLDYTPETLIDVGAGIGLSSIWFAYFMPTTQVYASESNEASVRLIERVRDDLNLSNLHIGDSLETYDCGVFFEVVEHIQSDYDKTTGAPFPWLDTYLERIKTNFVYSTYWSKNEISVGHFDRYDFGNGPLDAPLGWGRKFHKEIVKRGWDHDRRHDFYGSLPNVFWKQRLGHTQT